MIIGKGTTKDRIAVTEVDFGRDIEVDRFVISVPTRVSIIYVGGRYFSRCDEEPFTGIVTVFAANEYVNWNGKVYDVSSPEKYAVLKNIIMTDFAICRLE